MTSCRKSRATRCLLLIVAICNTIFPAIVKAEQQDMESITSVLYLDVSLDDADGTGFFLDTDLALSEIVRMSFGGGDSFASDYRVDEKTSTYHVGVSVAPVNDFSIGIDYEHWGRDGSLTTESWRLDLVARYGDWSFRLSPEFRTIIVYTTSSNQAELDSEAYGVNISYYSPSQWFVNLSHQNISYETDFRRPAINLFFLGVLSLQTLELMSVLNDSQTGVTLGYELNGGDQLGIDWLESDAVFDSVSYTNISLFYDKYLSDHWGAVFRVGQQRSDSSAINDLMIYSLSLGYFW